MSNSIHDLWFDYLDESGLCGLCANSGMIDTRGKLTSSRGMPLKGIHEWCICPNGRALKKQHLSLSLATKEEQRRSSDCGPGRPRG